MINQNPLNDRQSKIVYLLISDAQYITSEFIANKLSLSERTIKTDIQRIKNTLSPYGIQINSKKGRGYYIVNLQKNRLLISDLISITASQIAHVSNDRIQRVDSIIVSILSSKEECIPLTQICDQFFISRTTLINDFELFKKRCEEFNLNFKYIAYYGLEITGYEISKRMFLQKILLQYGNSFIINDDNLINRNSLEEKLKQILSTLPYKKISSVEFFNLLAHLRILLDRNRRNFFTNDIELSLDQSYDTFVDKIYAFLNQNSNFGEVPLNEAKYFCILVIGCNLGISDSTSDMLAEECLNELSKITHIKFENETLKYSLSSYIYALNLRLSNSISQNISIINDICIFSPLSTELSYRFFKILASKIGRIIPIDEVIYAAHFFLSIRDYLKPFHNPFKILVVSNKGEDISKHLIKELSENFSYYEFIYSDPNDVSAYIKTLDIQLILSDGNYNSKDVECLNINFFMQSKDFKNIRDYLRIISTRYFNKFYNSHTDLNIDTKINIINHLFEQDTRKYIINRDNQLSYEIGDVVLIFEFGELNSSHLYKLSKPIIWSKQWVSYILIYNVCEISPILDLHDFLRKVNFLKT